MPYLTIIVSAGGDRSIVNQDVSRSSHVALFREVVSKKPSGLAAIELWDSSTGKFRASKVEAAKDAPKLDEVLAEHAKAEAEQKAKVIAAIAADKKRADEARKKAEAEKAEPTPKAAPKKKAAKDKTLISEPEKE